MADNHITGQSICQNTREATDMGGERQRILDFMVQLLDRCTWRLWVETYWGCPQTSNTLVHFSQYLHIAGVHDSWKPMPRKTHYFEFHAIISRLCDSCAHWNNTLQYYIRSFICGCSYMEVPHSVGNYEGVSVVKKPSHSNWHKTIQGWRDHLNNQVHNPSSYSDYWTVSGYEGSLQPSLPSSIFGCQVVLLLLPLLFRETEI